jgi:TolB-like protein
MSPSARAYVLDLAERRLYRDGEPLILTPKMFALLALLVEERGRLLEKSEILERVWPGTVVSEACIKDYVKGLRQALGDDAASPRHIETRRGLGYQYIGDIAVRRAEPRSEIRPSTIEPPAEPVVLVLPFENAGIESDAYLADGVSEDVSAALGRFRQLVVISPLSSAQCRSLPVVEAARRARSRWVVTGKLARRGGSLCIDAQLVDGTTGALCWAERYQGEASALSAFEEQLVSRVVTTLVGQLDQAHTRGALAKPSRDQTAHDRVLRARHRLALMTQADILEARASLLQALELHPGSAAVHTWLAETYYCEAQAPWSSDPRSAAERVLEHGQRAVELDGMDSLAHLSVAWGYLMLRESTELAAAQARHALELNPNDYYTLCFISALRLCSGDVDGALASSAAALERSPLAPSSCLVTRGFAHYLKEEYLKALDAFGSIHRPRPEVHAGVAACYAQLGRMAEAQAAARTFFSDSVAQNLTLDTPEAWHSHFRRCLPLYDTRCLSQLLDGLRRAGLP